MAPYTPAGHTAQAPEPSGLYCPGPHPAATGLVEPRAHANPGEHVPLHVGEDRPGVLPKVPGGHGAEQVDEVKPCVAPYRPIAQGVQIPAPGREYLPAGHRDAVETVDPATHAYPAVQLPLHVATAMPGMEP